MFPVPPARLIPQIQGDFPVGYPIDGPNFGPVYDFANEREMMILSHSWGSPKTLAKLATAYPGIKFLVGHFAAGRFGPLTCEFENGSADLKVVFNRAGQISGLWNVPPQ